MGHIGHQQSSHFIRNLSELGKIQQARVGAGTRDNQLGAMFLCKIPHLIVVNAARFFVYAIRCNVVQLPRKVEGVTMGEVSPLIQLHGEHGVSRFEHREVNGLVGGTAGVRLDVCVFRPK